MWLAKLRSMRLTSTLLNLQEKFPKTSALLLRLLLEHRPRSPGNDSAEARRLPDPIAEAQKARCASPAPCSRKLHQWGGTDPGPMPRLGGSTTHAPGDCSKGRNLVFTQA